MVNFNPAIVDRLNSLSQSALRGHYIFSREFDDGYLSKRYSKQDAWPHNVRVSTVNSRKHIEQYFAIREETYKTSVGANFYAGEDEYDGKSHIVLALAGDNCIGGIRITVSSPENRMALPTEKDGFQFKTIYDKIEFEDLTYCEATRLAILPDFRNSNVLPMLFEAATKYAIDVLGVEMVFGRAANLQTRIFQTHYRNMGYNLVIRRDIKPPSKGMDAAVVQIFGIDFTPERVFEDTLKSYNTNNAKPEEVSELEFA